MSIQDFCRKIHSDNSHLFKALRKISSIGDPHEVLPMKYEIEPWSPWPIAELRAPAAP